MLNLRHIPINKTCNCGQHHFEIPSAHGFVTDGQMVMGVTWQCPKCDTGVCLSAQDLVKAINALADLAHELELPRAS